MPPGDTELLELVGYLHDGVVDDAMWHRALGGICALLDVQGFMMGAISPDGRRVELRFSHRAASHAVALLEGPLADPACNPWLALPARHALRRIVTIDDIGGQERLERTRVWREFYLPLQFGDSVGAVLERQPESADVLIAGRHADKPAFRPSEREALQNLLPHIARAWRVKAKLAEWQGLAGTLKFVLDRIERGVVITDAEGKVRFANEAADRLLCRGDAIDARGGHLRTKRPNTTDVLRTLIGRAAETAVGADAMAVDAISLSSEGEHPALAVVAEPLAPAHGDCLGHGAAAGAILFIGDSSASRYPSAERLRTVYGLTQAEAKVASLIVEGIGLTGACNRLHVSLNTAKYHLKAVFEKVGVSSQVQLVRRVLADVGGLAEPEKLRPATLPQFSP